MAMRGNVRGCTGTGPPTIHWRHFEPPIDQKNVCAVLNLVLEAFCGSGVTCGRRTK